MTYNTPLPISGRDPDTVPLKERVAEFEEAKRDPMKAIRAILLGRPGRLGVRPFILSSGARGWLLSAAAISPGDG